MITETQTAAILTLIGERMRFKPGTDRTPITETTVAVWKTDFDRANCNHFPIMERAVARYFTTDAAQYGITPQGLIDCYKTLVRDIAARVADWQQLDYRQRQAILADPAHVAHAAGEITTAEFTARTADTFIAELEARTGIAAADAGLPMADYLDELDRARSRRSTWQNRHNPARAAAARTELDNIRNQGDTA